MLARYVLADLLRNPRRTLSTMCGVVLGVGLFCGVLFFVDGLSASMTQRAAAPIPIDMQRIVTERAGVAVVLTQTFDAPSGLAGHERVDLEITNLADTPANEVTIRSVPGAGLAFVEGSAELDGDPIVDVVGNPFAQGITGAGLNLGVLEPGGTRHLSYVVAVNDADLVVDDSTVRSSFSTRESVNPIPANRPPLVALEELADSIGRVPGVARALPLSIADLGSDTLHAGDRTALGPAKIFGFDSGYEEGDDTIRVIQGSLAPDGAVLSAEAAEAVDVTIGDLLTVDLPDGSSVELAVTGVADLSRSRSLFSSRRGGDLETFIYVRNAVIVAPRVFRETVFPAFERAAATAGDRLKNPPLREIDIALDRELLDADPATAVGQTERLAGEVMAVAAHQDFLLDNISNALTVAADDAAVAKRLFVFLGVPGGLLAAVLAVYAGNVLAEAQRREQATLRVRGASRRQLLRMLALRTTLLTGVGSVAGLAAGYVAAAVVLGRGSLERASTASLAFSGVLGTLAGFAATGAGLYFTGRRSIDREINEDRARLVTRPPLWLRLRLDLAGLATVGVGTAWALGADAFAGTPGSVYFGRSVELNLALLVLPLAVWVTGSLSAGRLLGFALVLSRPMSRPVTKDAWPALVRRSVSRRPWAIVNGAIVASLVVALATSLAAFSASYDRAKTDDARYANGADIRITPSPAANRTYTADDGSLFQLGSITDVTPVIHSLSNVILRSERTSDPANLVAIAPDTYATVAPLDEATTAKLQLLEGDDVVLLSSDMAGFLKIGRGDTVNVLLARATPEQVEIEMVVADLFERLPGFPDGADAVMNIDVHLAAVPTKPPDLFLAVTDRSDDTALEEAVRALRAGPAGADQLQIDTRATMLARDQSSLAALNIAGLIDLDSAFALTMGATAVAIFVFGLLLQRRREYVTLRAQGLDARAVRLLIAAESTLMAVAGILAGVVVGLAMGFYFVAVLRPLFVLDPGYAVPFTTVAWPVLLVAAAGVVSSLAGSKLVSSLEPAELLRDD